MNQSSQQERKITLRDLRHIEETLNQRIYEIHMLDSDIRKMITMSQLYALSMVTRLVRLTI